MLAIDRFILHPMQKYTYTALNCPVRVCCSRQCTGSRSGVNFVQVRMKNLSERFICNIFLTIEAFGENGESLYELRRVVLPECNAEAGTLFGEERLIALGGQIAASLAITVESVVFDDGMIWRKDTIYRPKEPETPTVPQEAQEPQEPEAHEAQEPQEQMISEAAGAAPESETLSSELERIMAEHAAPVWESEAINPKIAQIVSEPIERKIERIMGELAHANSEQAVSAPRPEPVVRQDWTPTEPAKKKKSHALWIWLLIILGLGLAAVAVYLLYKNGNFSSF